MVKDFLMMETIQGPIIMLVFQLTNYTIQNSTILDTQGYSWMVSIARPNVLDKNWTVVILFPKLEQTFLLGGKGEIIRTKIKM